MLVSVAGFRGTRRRIIGVLDFKIRNLLAIVAAGAMALAGAFVAPQQVRAENHQRTVVGERYVPTIWVDPDGCEHWVMDDGAEGYMTPHVSRQGIPVCRRAAMSAAL